MKVFISWSGEPSKAIASAFYDFLRDVIQNVKPFMSAHDIGAGTRWPERLNRELATTGFGILCLTPQNQDGRWILFEAGALSKALEHAWVCPYLFGLKPTDLKWPLAQFNANLVDEPGTREIVRSINTAMGDSGLPDDVLERSFNRCWKEYEARLKAIPKPEEAPKLEDREILEEILSAIRKPIIRMPTMQELFSEPSGGSRASSGIAPGWIMFSNGPLSGYTLTGTGDDEAIAFYEEMSVVASEGIGAQVEIVLDGNSVTLNSPDGQTCYCYIRKPASLRVKRSIRAIYGLTAMPSAGQTGLWVFSYKGSKKG
jgi:hypothetical protein